MNNNLKEFSGELVEKFKGNTLTFGELHSYLDFSNSRMKQVYSFSTMEEFKNATIPFLVMLSNPKFTNNDYLWQTISGRAYYISSYYIQLRILGEFNTPKPEDFLDYIELLKLRLLILSNGKSHFPELVFKVPNNPNLKLWSPLSSSGPTDKDGYKDIELSDAVLLSKFASMFIPFRQDALDFANSIISDNSNRIRNSSIEDIMQKGLEMHIMFFNYLHYLVEKNNTIDFHTDED